MPPKVASATSYGVGSAPVRSHCATYSQPIYLRQVSSVINPGKIACSAGISARDPSSFNHSANFARFESKQRTCLHKPPISLTLIKSVVLWSELGLFVS